MKAINIAYILIFIFIAAPSITLAVAKDAEQVFFNANVYYAEGQYEEAIPLYLQALDSFTSSNIHYNLGNAYYQTGRPGLARLHWEKAIAMNPRHAPAQFHREMLLNEFNLGEQQSGYWYNLLAKLSFNQWVLIATASFWIMLFFWLWQRARQNNRLVFLMPIPALMFILGLNAIWMLSPELNKAIVTDAEATLRVAPTPGSPISQTLTEAQGITIGQKYGEYYRATLHNGQEGFIRQGQWQSIR